MRLTFQVSAPRRQVAMTASHLCSPPRTFVCTYDLRMDKAPEKLRVNPGAFGLQEPRPTQRRNGDSKVTLIHLKAPAAAFLMLISGGPGADLSCHVSPEKMRRQPIGTSGPQVRRLQGQTIHQGGAHTRRLLESRAALS